MPDINDANITAAGSSDRRKVKDWLTGLPRAGGGGGGGGTGGQPPQPTGTTPVRAFWGGVNLVSASFNSNQTPSHFDNYLWPDVADYNYFAGKNLHAARVLVNPHWLVDLSSNTYWAFDIGKLDALVSAGASKNGLILICFGGIGAGTGYVRDSRNANANQYQIGSSTQGTTIFANYWTAIATRYKNHPNVHFDLMNEPDGLQITADQWKTAMQAGVNAIRATGSQNVIHLPPRQYQHASNMASSFTGPAQTYLEQITDPLGNFDRLWPAFHMYLDSDESGTNFLDSAVTGGDVNTGITRLTPATTWARAQGGRKIWLGEFGAAWDFAWNGSATPIQRQAIQNTLNYVKTNNDVWKGFTWWQGGPWFWNADNDIQPENWGGGANTNPPIDQPSIPYLSSLETALT